MTTPGRRSSRSTVIVPGMPSSRPRACGFTLIEMIIVVCIVALLASMLFKRVMFYQELAEKAAMEQVVGAVQSALVLQYGHRMAMGMGPEVNNITAENPLDWLTQKPGSYAGELDGVEFGKLRPGSWAYDKNAHELVYVPDHAEFFEAAQDGNKWIRFRTRLLFEPAVPGRSKVLSGAVFGPVEPYKWLIKDNS